MNKEIAKSNHSSEKRTELLWGAVAYKVRRGSLGVTLQPRLMLPRGTWLPGRGRVSLGSHVHGGHGVWGNNAEGGSVSLLHRFTVENVMTTRFALFKNYM